MRGERNRRSIQRSAFWGAGLQVTLQAAMERALGTNSKTYPETNPKTKESTSGSTINEAPAVIRTLSPNTVGTQVLAPRNQFAINGWQKAGHVHTALQPTVRGAQRTWRSRT